MDGIGVRIGGEPSCADNILTECFMPDLSMKHSSRVFVSYCFGALLDTSHFSASAPKSMTDAIRTDAIISFGRIE